MKTIITNDPEEAGRCLKNNGIVVFPTETVYGIGVSARNFHGCNKIYEIKGRPKDNPFIVHVGELSMVDEIGYVIPNLWKVIKRFSPGPITYILPKKDQTVFSSGLSTIGIRIPNLGITNTMLKIADVPVAAPSANISGKPSITRVQDAIEVFEGLVNVILNGGNCEVGL